MLRGAVPDLRWSVRTEPSKGGMIVRKEPFFVAELIPQRDVDSTILAWAARRCLSIAG